MLRPILLGLGAILAVSVTLPTLIYGSRQLTSYLYGPFLVAPALLRPPRYKGSSILAMSLHALRFQLTRCGQAAEVVTLLSAVYLGFGIVSMLTGSSIIAIYKPAMAASLSYSDLFLLTVLGIAVVVSLRLFSVVHSTAPLVWATFYIATSIGIAFPVSAIVQGGVLKALSDNVAQMGGVDAIVRLQAIDKLVLPALVVSIGAAMLAELSIVLVIGRRLRTVPLGLFDEYRKTFLVHEQRFSRRGVTQLYFERLDALAGRIGADEKTEVLWATYSGTTRILRKLIELTAAYDQLEVRVLTTPKKRKQLEVFLADKDSLRIAIRSVTRRCLPCPRFMVLGNYEILSALSVPPKDSHNPCDSPSNMAFRNGLADSIIKACEVFNALYRDASS